MEYTTLQSIQNTGADAAHAVSEDHIAGAILSVIQTARSNGQSLDDVMGELLADDAILDQRLRSLLGDIVSQAWQTMA